METNTALVTILFSGIRAEEVIHHIVSKENLVLRYDSDKYALFLPFGSGSWLEGSDTLDEFAVTDGDELQFKLKPFDVRIGYCQKSDDVDNVEFRNVTMDICTPLKYEIPNLVKELGLSGKSTKYSLCTRSGEGEDVPLEGDQSLVDQVDVSPSVTLILRKRPKVDFKKKRFRRQHNSRKTEEETCEVVGEEEEDVDVYDDATYDYHMKDLSPLPRETMTYIRAHAMRNPHLWTNTAFESDFQSLYFCYMADGQSMVELCAYEVEAVAATLREYIASIPGGLLGSPLNLLVSQTASQPHPRYRRRYMTCLLRYACERPLLLHLLRFLYDVQAEVDNGTDALALSTAFYHSVIWGSDCPVPAEHVEQFIVCLKHMIMDAPFVMEHLFHRDTQFAGLAVVQQEHSSGDADHLSVQEGDLVWVTSWARNTFDAALGALCHVEHKGDSGFVPLSCVHVMYNFDTDEGTWSVGSRSYAPEAPAVSVPVSSAPAHTPPEAPGPEQAHSAEPAEPPGAQQQQSQESPFLRTVAKLPPVPTPPRARKGAPSPSGTSAVASSPPEPSRAGSPFPLSPTAQARKQQRPPPVPPKNPSSARETAPQHSPAPPSDNAEDGGPPERPAPKGCPSPGSPPGPPPALNGPLTSPPQQRRAEDEYPKHLPEGQHSPLKGPRRQEGDRSALGAPSKTKQKQDGSKGSQKARRSPSKQGRHGKSPGKQQGHGKGPSKGPSKQQGASKGPSKGPSKQQGPGKGSSSPSIQRSSPSNQKGSLSKQKRPIKGSSSPNIQRPSPRKGLQSPSKQKGPSKGLSSPSIQRPSVGRAHKGPVKAHKGPMKAQPSRRTLPNPNTSHKSGHKGAKGALPVPPKALPGARKGAPKKGFAKPAFPNRPLPRRGQSEHGSPSAVRAHQGDVMHMNVHQLRQALVAERAHRKRCEAEIARLKALVGE